MSDKKEVLLGKSFLSALIEITRNSISRFELSNNFFIISSVTNSFSTSSDSNLIVISLSLLNSLIPFISQRIKVSEDEPVASKVSSFSESSSRLAESPTFQLIPLDVPIVRNLPRMRVKRF